MCSINVHEKEHQYSCDYVRRGEGCPLPSNSTTEALHLLGATIYFINFWLKYFEHNFIERCNLYYHNMDKLFQKIPVKFPNQTIPR